MPLLLEYLADAGVPIEMAGITPEKARRRTVGEIEKLNIPHGNRDVPLGELFRVSGDPGDEIIHLEGDLGGLHAIGAGMSRGEVCVYGSAGRRLGCEMIGGAIHVEGAAGDWAGAQMRGGLIHIRQSAGDSAGAAFPGGPRGMSGGTILIEGDAGAEVGCAMRRGLIVVGGATGELPGRRLLAGTILVLGPCGARPGVSMRRGTLGLLGRPSPSLPPSFRKACRYRPVILPMLLSRLKSLGFERDISGVEGRDVELFHGDMLEGGRGEILLPVVD